MNNIVWFGIWFRHHNNARLAELLPRLPMVDVHQILLSSNPLIWRIQFRLHSRVYPRLVYPFTFKRLSKEYGFLFCTGLYQIQLFDGGIVVDADDPTFSPKEMELLSHPRVRAVVTTTEILKERFIEKGLTKDIVIMPQGVSLRDIDEKKVEEIAKQYKSPGDIVIGYSSPYLFLVQDIREGDTGREMNSVEYLIQVMEKVWREEPNAKLWLLGNPRQSLLAYAKGEPRIKLFGYIAHNDILNYVKNFDVAVYPRLVDVGGRFSVKLIEYMGCGAPIVSTNVSESFIIKQAGSGLVTSTADEFAEALIELCRDAKLRKSLGDKGTEFAADYDWDILAERYQREVFDVYCDD